MTQWTITTAIVLNQATGQVALDLAGQQVQVVVRGTTTPYPIIETGSLDPIPSSLLTVSPIGTLPPFIIETDTPEDLYLDWRDSGSGVQGGIGFEEVMRAIAVQARDAAQAAQASLDAAVVDAAAAAVVDATAAATAAQQAAEDSAAAAAAAQVSTSAELVSAVATAQQAVTSAQQAATNAQAASAQVQAMLQGADGTIDQLVAGLISAPASAVHGALASSGLGSGGSGRVDYVYITDDGATWPVRPTSDPDIVVLWVGGSDQPEEMLAKDLWLQSGGQTPADTTAPTVPAGLAASSITSTGFRLSWTASTDAVGVTGYQVQMDTGSGYTLVGAPTTTEQLIGALSASQEVQVRVRARDAAGNWSAWSSSLLVETAASGSLARHCVFSGDYPYTTVVDNLAQQPTVANGFYTYTADATGWKVVGARIWVPAGVLDSLPDTVEVMLWHQAGVLGSGATAPNLATPTETVTSDSLVEGWNEIYFTTPRVMTVLAPVWIGYRFAGTAYLVSVPAPASAGFVAAGDGSPLVLSEVLNNGIRRGYARQGTGATTAVTTNHVHGVDIIVEVD